VPDQGRQLQGSSREPFSLHLPPGVREDESPREWYVDVWERLSDHDRL
jgi:hypothetical protein